MNIFKGDPKALFLIATTPRCRGGYYSISLITPLYPWSKPYNASVKQGSNKYNFLSLWYNSTWDWTLVSRAIVEHYTLNQWPICKMVRAFKKLGFNPRSSHTKDPPPKKTVLDYSLLNTQHYKVWIKGKVKQSRERSSTLPYTSVW